MARYPTSTAGFVCNCWKAFSIISISRNNLLGDCDGQICIGLVSWRPWRGCCACVLFLSLTTFSSEAAEWRLRDSRPRPVRAPKFCRHRLSTRAGTSPFQICLRSFTASKFPTLWDCCMGTAHDSAHCATGPNFERHAGRAYVAWATDDCRLGAMRKSRSRHARSGRRGPNAQCVDAGVLRSQNGELHC